MRAWSRKYSLGGLKLRSDMDAHEAAVLRSLVSSVVGLLDAREADAPKDDLAELTGFRSGNSSPPDDAVLSRLLPDFHRPGKDEDGTANADDEGADLNGALRSLHEPEIIDAKRAAASVLLDTLPARGGRITLTPEQAEAWLTALNDVRLAMGTTLGVDSDTPDELPEDDPRAGQIDVYHWLTWMQDTLVQAVMG